jgi:hypothetical protein
MAIDGNVDLGDLTDQETPFLLDGSLEPALPLPLLLLDGAGFVGAAFNGFAPGLTLPAFALPDAGMADGMLLAPPRLDGHMEAGTLITGRLDLLAPTASGSLEPALALPVPKVAGTLEAGAIIAAQLLTLPALQLAGRAADSADLVLPAFTADGELAGGSVARAALTLPMWQVDATGYQDTAGDGLMTLALLQLDARGGAEALVDGAVTLDLFALEASAGTGQLAEAFLTVPLFEVDASGFMDAVGSATLALPAFVMDSASIRLARPHATAIVLNTRLKGVVRYEGVQANSFATFAGMHLAATPDGIVALMGETDLGAPIAASITSGTSDLGSIDRKRVEAAYVGYRAANDLEMTLITDEHHEYSYRLVARQIPDRLHGNRVKFGRGVDGRYWQWQLANTAGAQFELASLALYVIPLGRAV